MNQYPYGQVPQQQMPQQIPPQQIPPQTPMYPAYPPKRKFFDDEMLGILACTISAVGLFLSIAAAVIASTVTFVYGLIAVILAFLISSGGCIFSFIISNKNLRSGQSRGAIPSLGIIMGATGVVLFFFLIFFAGCTTCYYNKIGFKWPS